MNELTDKQIKVLKSVAKLMQHNGVPPTRKEIAEKLGFRSANAAQQHLKALERKGMVSLDNGKSRSITILSAGQLVLGTAAEHEGLAVIGKVAAGQPILAAAHVEGHYHIDPNLFSPAADYLLRVEGDSMKECGILDGDLLVVQANTTQQLPKNRQIVVARLNDEVTVKRFYRASEDSPIISLLPENPAFQAIQIDLNEQSLNIEGFGLGVIRSDKRKPL